MGIAMRMRARSAIINETSRFVDAYVGKGRETRHLGIRGGGCVRPFSISLCTQET